MIPLKALAAEKQDGEYGEYRECDHLLDYLELHQGERAAVAVEAYAVCRHLKAVLGKSDEP